MPAQTFEVSREPPPGFEDLDAPQTTQVDVLFQGQWVASALATYTPDTIQFDDPAALVAQLGAVRDIDAVIAALSGPLPVHTDALCRLSNRGQCAGLEVPVAGVVFDAGLFRAELFVHPDRLHIQTLEVPRYLPPAGDGLGSIHTLALNLSGEGSEQLANLSGYSVAALGESRLVANYDVDSNDGLSFEELNVQHDHRDLQFEAGAFRSLTRSMAVYADTTLLGARVATSLNTRTDLETASGTPIFVFLERRSRVDVYRGSRLIDSRFYSAGNQQLDTQRFPAGAYNIEVRIAGDAGVEKVEQFYFARTALLPPMGEDYRYFEAGTIANRDGEGALPDSLGANWLRAGYARRFRDDFGAEVALLRAGDDTLLEAGVVWLTPGLTWQSGVVLGGAGQTGVSLRGLWQYADRSLSFDLRHVSGATVPATGDKFHLLDEDYSQANITAVFPLSRGRLFLRGQFDHRGGALSNRLVAVNYQQPVIRRAGYAVDFSVDASNSQNGYRLLLGVDLRWRRRDSLAQLRPRVEAQSGAGGDLLMDARYTHNLRSSAGSAWQTTTYLTRETDRNLVGGRLQGEGSLGYGGLEVQQDFANDVTRYAAAGTVNLVTSSEGVAIGGRRGGEAAVVIELGGEPDNGLFFEVFIDDQARGSAFPGKTNVFPLPPYATYQVRLEPRGAGFVEFDQSIRRVTLYPGNVQTLDYSVEPRIVLIGELRLASGEPLAHARFASLDGFAGTDENGWFQVEVPRIETLSLTSRDGSTCTVALGNYQVQDGLAVLPPQVCR